MSQRLPNPPADNAPVLLPYQQAWVADASPLKVIEKSRRTGITWAEAADNVLTAASDRSAGGQNVYYIAYNQDMTIEYIQACTMWAKAFNRAASEMEAGFWDGDKEDRHIRTFTLRFPASGFRIVALTSRPSNLRGRQGIIVIDEAAFHDQLDELLKAALAMLIWGGKVRIISTHNGIANPFAELIESIRAGKRSGNVHRITFREAIAQGLYRRVCLRAGREWTQAGQGAWTTEVYQFYGEGASEELDCIPSQSGGAYLPLVLIDARMAAVDTPVPVIRQRWTTEFGLLPEHIRAEELAAWIEEELAEPLAALDKNLRHTLGVDFARVGDLSVFCILAQSKTLVSMVRLVIEAGNLPFAQQRQLLKAICDRLPRFYAGALDATGNGADLAEHAADLYGHTRISQVKLNDNWYLANMPAFRAALEDATLGNLPRDEQCRDDLRALQRINGVPKLPKAKTQTAGGNKAQRHGDFAISLVLAHTAMRMEAAPIEYTPAPAGSGIWDDAPDQDNNTGWRNTPAGTGSPAKTTGAW